MEEKNFMKRKQTDRKYAVNPHRSNKLGRN